VRPILAVAAARRRLDLAACGSEWHRVFRLASFRGENFLNNVVISFLFDNFFNYRLTRFIRFVS
jgi:hypothetical protein